MSHQATAARSALWMLLGNAAQQLVVFALFIVLARLLGPEQFGVMAAAAVILDLGLSIAKWGLVETTQRDGELGERARSTRFWVSLIIGASVSITIALSATTIAQLYRMPELASVIYVVAPCSFIQSLGNIHEGVLRREFGYRSLAGRNVLAAVAGGGVAVALVSIGFGVTALAAQRLTSVSILAVAVVVAGRWTPALQFDIPEAKRVVSSGSKIMVASSLTLLTGRIVDVVVGVTMGAVALGNMRIALRVFDFINQFAIQPIASVALSSFSRAVTHPDGLRNDYVQSVRVATIMLAPMLIGVGVLSDVIVAFVFGVHWAGAAPLLAILSAIAFATSPNFLTPPALIASGRDRGVAVLGVFGLVCALAIALIAVQFSTAAVVAGHVIRAHMVAVAGILILQRGNPRLAGEVLVNVLPAVVAGVIMALVVFGAGQSFLQGASLLVHLLGGCALGAGAYSAVLIGGERLGLWRGRLRPLFPVVLPWRRSGLR